MKKLLSKLHRLRWHSELHVLRFSRKLWLLAPMPIFLMIFFWCFVYALPILPVAIFTILIVEHDPQPPSWLFLAATLLQMIIALPMTIIGFIYMIKWYVVAVSLMFGRTKFADRKEAFLRERLGLPTTSSTPQ
ncbi:hypothetical protein [Celeribacter sp. ULVN23_4]